MEATSSGFILEIPSPPSFPPHSPAAPLLLLPIGIPSTTYKGWLLPLKELAPLITTLELPAAPVAFVVIFTPAILPCKLFIALVVFTLDISSPLT